MITGIILLICSNGVSQYTILLSGEVWFGQDRKYINIHIYRFIVFDMDGILGSCCTEYIAIECNPDGSTFRAVLTAKSVILFILSHIMVQHALTFVLESTTNFYDYGKENRTKETLSPL